MFLSILKKIKKNKFYNEELITNLLYKISFYFILLIMIRLLILQEFINTTNEIIEPIKESLYNIENSELVKNPLEKIKKEINNAAKNPLTEDDINEIGNNLKMIINDSVNPILDKID